MAIRFRGWRLEFEYEPADRILWTPSIEGHRLGDGEAEYFGYRKAWTLDWLKFQIHLIKESE